MRLNIIIGSISLLLIKLTFFPDIKLMAWLLMAFVIDFLTGVVKSYFNKKAISSQGFRQTAIKALQYSGLLIAGIIIGNSFEKNSELVKWVNDGMVLFLLYVEVYSIFENLRDMNPESKVAKMLFNPALTILTLGMQRLSMSKLHEEKKQEINKDFSSGNTTLIVLFIGSLFALSSCTVVRPGENNSYSKKDTTTTTYKKVDVEVKGGTVTNSVNIDSLFAAWKKSLPPNQQMNVDSLYKAFIKGLKKDTVTVTDYNSKAQLKYWYDEFGKLQMSCTAKDQTVSLMVAEITRLTQEVTKKQTTNVVYKMTWWGWILVGCGTLSTIVLLVLLALWFINHKRTR